MTQPSISIIIPVLNESHTILGLIKHLESKVHSLSNISDIIIVDGGSDDDTYSKVLTLSQKCPKSKIQALSSQKGRALQMNAGALVASGSILYFLHADSYPPQDYDKAIIDEASSGNLAGCFRMRFDSNHWWLRIAGWFTQFSWRMCRGGDQSQFITTPLFETLGGYDESFTIYEDNDLIDKLYAQNTFVVINKKLTTSARRYHHNGTWKLQYHYFAIHLKKWFGASPEELNNYYKQHII